MKIPNNNIKIFNGEKTLFYFISFDILMLPYFRWGHCLSSMILLVVWYIFKCKSIFVRRKEMGAITIFVMLIVLSLVRALYQESFDKTVLNYNVTYTVIIVYVFLYYYYFQYTIRKYNLQVESIFKVYVIFVCLLAVVYCLNPQGYFDLRALWTLNGEHIEFVAHIYNRFTGIVSDPNNINGIITAIMLFFLIKGNISESKKILIIICTGAVVITTMSMTGICVYAASLAGWILVSGNNWKGKAKKKLVLSVLILIITGSFIIILWGEQILRSNVVSTAIQRYILNSSNGGSGRFDIWKNFFLDFDLYQYIILGKGNFIFNRNGLSYRPHNGHFYLILSYGFISYAIFTSIFFRKQNNNNIKEWFILFPLFMVLSVNTGMIDVRFAFAFALIIAAQNSKKACLKMRR